MTRIHQQVPVGIFGQGQCYFDVVSMAIERSNHLSANVVSDLDRLHIARATVLNEDVMGVRRKRTHPAADVCQIALSLGM